MAIQNNNSYKRLSKTLNSALIAPGYRPENDVAIEAMLETIGGEQLSSEKMIRMLRKIKGKEQIGSRAKQETDGI